MKTVVSFRLRKTIHKGEVKMRIDITDKKSIMVELSKDDLSKSEITYEQLDYSNPQTRKLVRRILEKIRSETGLFASECSALEVEVMPDSFGGCLMFFKETQKAKEPKNEAALFACKNISDLIDCSRAAKKACKSLPSAALYQNEGGYLLFVAECPEGLSALLCEYLSKCTASQMELAVTLEHSVCLAENNSLVLLSGKKL